MPIRAKTSETGATSVEYALLVGVIAIGIISAAVTLQQRISSTLGKFPGGVTTLSGSGAAALAEGTAKTGSFWYPHGMAIGPGGDVLVADCYTHRIRRVTASGDVSTFAGSGGTGAGGAGSFANGPGTSSTFKCPTGVVASGSDFFVADRDHNRIRRITSAGVVSTFSGTGTSGGTNGAANVATFAGPYGIAADGDGNLYVAEFFGHRIRKVAPDGSVTTLAGSGTAGFADGTGVAAQFNGPNGVAVDGGGNVYVTDHQNNRIRKITPAGVVTTLAGSSAGYADGAGTAARFNGPAGIASDGGSLYVAEFRGHRIRKVTSDGTVSTISGTGVAGWLDGEAATAEFYYPIGVMVGPMGLYVGDYGNNRIRVISFMG